MRFFKNISLYRIKDGLSMFFALGFFGVLSIILAALIGWVIFYLIDSSFLDEQFGRGVVVGKHYESAHTSTTVIYNGKTYVPVVHNHPDDWILTIEMRGESDHVSVESSFYNDIEIGDKVRITYTTGRFSGGLYINHVAP